VGKARAPVMDLEEPPLQAEIMISSSMTESLIFSLPLCTMKTSLSRIDVSGGCQQADAR